MDIQQIWETINQRVDWLWAGILSLLIGSLVVGGYGAMFYLNKEDVLDKHGLGGLRSLEVDENVLEDLPDLDEIEVEPPSEAEEFPERYAELKGTDLFIPLAGRGVSESKLAELPGEQSGSDTEDVDKKPTLPPIEGFEITGRILGDEDEVKIGLLKRTEDDRMFIAREGEYLEGTEIQVKNISDTTIRLAKPQHRETEFQFDVDRMSQQIKEQIMQH